MRIYLDLDGVLADFDAGVVKHFGVEPSEELIRRAMHLEGFFRDLTWMPGSRDAVTSLLEMFPGRVSILSAVPKSDPHLEDVCRVDKTTWVNKHIPEITDIHVVLDKGTVGTQHDFLIDDRPDWNTTFPGTILKFTESSDWVTVLEILTQHAGVAQR